MTIIIIATPVAARAAASSAVHKDMKAGTGHRVRDGMNFNWAMM